MDYSDAFRCVPRDESFGGPSRVDPGETATSIKPRGPKRLSQLNTNLACE
jgi:hypothetical protein